MEYTFSEWPLQYVPKMYLWLRLSLGYRSKKGIFSENWPQKKVVEISWSLNYHIKTYPNSDFHFFYDLSHLSPVWHPFQMFGASQSQDSQRRQFLWPFLLSLIFMKMAALKDWLWGGLQMLGSLWVFHILQGLLDNNFSIYAKLSLKKILNLHGFPPKC